MSSITRYISPTGVGDGLTIGSPCSLSQAISDGNNNSPTGTGIGEGHSVYVLPGEYGSITLTSANWSGARVVGVSADGSPLTFSQVVSGGAPIFNGGESNQGLLVYVAISNISFSHLAARGNYAFRSKDAGSTTYLNYCLLSDSPCLVYNAAGATTLNSCKLTGATSTTQSGIINAASLVINNSVLAPAPTGSGFNGGGAGYGIQTSTGSLTINRTILVGAQNSPIIVLSGIATIKDSIIGASWTAGYNTIQKTSGTVNVINSLIGRNGYNYQYVSGSAFDTDTDNIIDNTPRFVSAPRGGILSLHYDDCGNSQRVIDDLQVLRSHGLIATYCVNLKWYFENPDSDDALNITNIYNNHSDAIELAPHTWAHTDMSMVHGLHFDNPNGGSISFSDVADPAILSNGDVYSGNCLFVATGPEPFIYDASGQRFSQIIAGINALDTEWVCSKSSTGQDSTHVSDYCCVADLLPLPTTAIVPGTGVDIDFDFTTDGTKGLYRQEVFLG